MRPLQHGPKTDTRRVAVMSYAIIDNSHAQPAEFISPSIRHDLAAATFVLLPLAWWSPLPIATGAAANRLGRMAERSEETSGPLAGWRPWVGSC